MQPAFQFEIGDAVASILHVDEIKMIMPSTNLSVRPQGMRIEERISVECIGGVQLFYACRCADGTVQRFPQWALTKSEVLWDAWINGMHQQEARQAANKQQT